MYYSINILQTLPAKSVDMVMTSPPYDNLRDYNNSSIWNFEVFKQITNGLKRIVKDGGVIIWVVNDATKNGSESGTSFKQALYFKEIGFNLHDTMIYQKQNYMPQNNSITPDIKFQRPGMDWDRFLYYSYH